MEPLPNPRIILWNGITKAWVGTLLDFAEVNELTYAECATIIADLDRHEEHRGGGGAVPAYILTLAEPVLLRSTTRTPEFYGLPRYYAVSVPDNVARRNFATPDAYTWRMNRWNHPINDLAWAWRGLGWGRYAGINLSALFA